MNALIKSPSGEATRPADLNSCGCCDGTRPLTPADTTNRPGLDELRYRIGTHSSFFQTMIARLTSLCSGSPKECREGNGDHPLREKLTTRNPDDPAIAILDAWAHVGDILTFYQERIANEGYLRTSKERRSLYELAGLVGYKPRPGVSAGVYLAFEVEAPPPISTATELTPGPPEPDPDAEIVIPRGTQAKSTPTPGTDEIPQVFETSVDFNARAGWNGMKLALSAPYEALKPAGHDSIRLSGTGLRIQPGDLLVLATSDTSHVVSVARDVLEDTDAQTTLIVFRDRPLDASVYAKALQAAWDRFRANQLRTDYGLTPNVARQFITAMDTSLRLVSQRQTMWAMNTDVRNVTVVIDESAENEDLRKDLEKVLNAFRKNVRNDWLLNQANELSNVLHRRDSGLQPVPGLFGSHLDELAKTVPEDLTGDSAAARAQRLALWRRTFLPGQNDQDFIALATTDVPEGHEAERTVTLAQHVGIVSGKSAAEVHITIEYLPVGVPRAGSSVTSGDAVSDISPQGSGSGDDTGAESWIRLRRSEQNLPFRGDGWSGKIRLDSLDTFKFTFAAGARGKIALTVRGAADAPAMAYGEFFIHTPNAAASRADVPFIADIESITEFSMDKLKGAFATGPLYAGTQVFHKARDGSTHNGRTPQRTLGTACFRAERRDDKGMIVDSFVQVVPFVTEVSPFDKKPIEEVRDFLNAERFDQPEVVRTYASGAKLLTDVLQWASPGSTSPAPVKFASVSELLKRKTDYETLASTTGSVPAESWKTLTNPGRKAIGAYISSVFAVSAAGPLRAWTLLHENGQPLPFVEDRNIRQLERLHHWVRNYWQTLSVGTRLSELKDRFRGKDGQGADSLLDHEDRFGMADVTVGNIKKAVDDLKKEFAAVEERQAGILWEQLRLQNLVDAAAAGNRAMLFNALASAVFGRLNDDFLRTRIREIPDRREVNVPDGPVPPTEADKLNQLALAEFLVRLGLPTDAAASQTARLNDVRDQLLRALSGQSTAGLSGTLAAGNIGELAALVPQVLSALDPEDQKRVLEQLRQARYEPGGDRLTVYAMRSKARLFGWNAPPLTSLTTPAGIAQSVTKFQRGTVKETKRAEIQKKLETALKECEFSPFAEEVYADPDILHLDGTFDATLPGSPIVIDTSPASSTEELRVAETDVAGVAEQVKTMRTGPRTAYGLSGESTEVGIRRPALSVAASSVTNGTALSEGESDIVRAQEIAERERFIRTTRVFCDAERLDLAEELFGEALSTDNELNLDGVYSGLFAGQKLLLSGIPSLFSPSSELRETELVEITDVGIGRASNGHGARFLTQLRLKKPLTQSYLRASVRLYGNVVEATHGETHSEILASGSGGEFDSAVLKNARLTHVAANTPSGTKAELTVTVNESEWAIQSDLNESGRNDEHFATRTSTSGITAVTFGDGEKGSRLPTGNSNVRAIYRSGLGLAGNVSALRIDQLTAPPLGVKGVSNPLHASGGADPDSEDTIRRQIPVGLSSLNRLVSESDYLDFAEQFAGVSRAHLDSVNGRLVLTVAAQTPAPLPRAHRILSALQEALSNYSESASVPVVVPHTSVLIGLEAQIALRRGATFDRVEERLREALFESFSFEAARYGQTIFHSELIRVIQNDPDVDYVASLDFKANRQDGVIPPKTSETAPDDLPPSGTDTATGSPNAPSRQASKTLRTGQKDGRIDAETARAADSEFMGADLCFISRSVPGMLLLTESNGGAR